MPTRLVIDTDPGVDDAHAIMLACAHRQHGSTVEAITTVAGNVGLERTTPNACTVLDALDVPAAETPVFAGSPRALVGPDVRTHYHGADGLGDCGFPPSARPVEREHAALALIRLASQSPGELTLAAIGPLTNLALAVRLDPALPGKFKRLVVMGGNIQGAGNMPNGSEYNFFVDPEAAAVVFEAWPGLWLVSWETTTKYRLYGRHLDELAGAGTPRAEFFTRIAAGMVGAMTAHYGQRSLHAPDGLAVAIALEPDIVTRSELRPARVEVCGEHTRGHSIVDWINRSGREPHVNVALELDFERFWALLKAAVA
jgi:purine nucleosidase